MNLDRVQSLLSRLSIKHRDLNVSVPFIFNPNQAKAHEMVKRHYAKDGHIRVVTLKARRVGMSSYWDSMLFCHCLARSQAHVEIVAHMKDVSDKGLFRVPRDLALELNDKVKWEVCDVRAKEIRFQHTSGESRLDIATAGSVGGGRGLTLTALHLSEAALYPGQDSFLSILPAVSKAPDTIIALESTAQGRTGIGQTFYEHWIAAGKRGRHWNGYVQIFLSWLDDPACWADSPARDAPATDLERELMRPPFNATRPQIAWMRFVLEGECQGSESKFLQEYPHCITGETRVSTEKGIVRVDQSEDCEVTESGKIEGVWIQEPSPIYKLTTKQGRVLRGTGEHPICTTLDWETNRYVPSRFVKLKDIQIGQEIVLTRPRFADDIYIARWRDFPGTESSITITEDWGKFLGYFMGDGSWYKGCLSIICDAKDEDVQQDVSELIERLFGKKPFPRVHARVRGCKGAVELRMSARFAESALEHLGIFKKTDDGSPYKRKVCVPECIFRSPRNVVAKFLSALFECDGSASVGQLRFATSKHQFAIDVQLLLLGFGITAKIYENKKKSGSGGDYTCYELAVGVDTISRFRSIMFVGNRKNDLIHPVINRHEIRQHSLSRPPFLTDSELRDEVKSVVLEDEAEQTYDFTISDDHVFSANGILTHNSAEVAFVSTGDPAFHPSEIKYAYSTRIKEGSEKVKRGILYRDGGRSHFRPDAKGQWFIYETPRPRCHYYIGVDCARGMEAESGRATGDFNAIAVFNGTTGDVAAKFSDWITIDLMANEVDKAARMYNMAMVNVELTGNLGLMVNRDLREQFTYPNLYIWKGKDDKVPKPGTRGHNQGWETNARTRDLLFATFRGKLRDGMKRIPGGLSPRDPELIQQMDVATMSTGMRWEVEKGHDDVLMSFMLAVIAAVQYPPPNMLAPTHNVMESAEERRESALAALHAQPELEKALRGDLRFVFRKERKQSRSALGIGV